MISFIKNLLRISYLTVTVKKEVLLFFSFIQAALNTERVERAPYILTA